MLYTIDKHIEISYIDFRFSFIIMNLIEELKKSHQSHCLLVKNLLRELTLFNLDDKGEF